MLNITEISTADEWNQALSSVETIDFYHTWDFHALSKKNNEGSPVLFRIYSNNSGMLVPLMVREIVDTDYRDLTSVYGYPSPLVYGGVSHPTILSMWERLIQYLTSAGYVSLFLRLHPLLTPESLANKEGIKCGKTVYIDLTVPEEEQIKQYRNAHKRNINTLKKYGVTCFCENDEDSLNSFILTYEKAMRSLNASNYYFFPRTYYEDMLAASNFDARIYQCHYNGDILCSGMFIFCDDIVQYHLGGTQPNFHKLAPSKLMFDTVRRDANSEQRKYFILGGGLGAKEDSLFNFKTGFSKHSAEFNLIKKVLNEDVYDFLSSHINRDTRFFPKYRSSAYEI